MPLYRRAGSPHWWVRIGRKTRRSTGTDDRAQAEEFERALTERLWRRDKLGDRGATSWAEAAESYLKSSTRPRKRDRALLKWLGSRIGEAAVAHVAEAPVLERLQKHGLAAGWSHATVDRMMRTVRAVLRFCWQRQILPAAPHVPMFGGDDLDEPRFITREQFAALLAELPPHLEVAARFAVATLLRKSSQARLTWDRVDLERRQAWIPRMDMKGKRSTFALALSDAAIDALQDARRLAPTGSRVFQYEGHGIDNFRTAAFDKAAQRAGLEGLRWHDLRHTGASWAAQSGQVTLQELMSLGGWKSMKMVLRYSHLMPSNTASAADKLGAIVAQAKKGHDAGKP